MSNSVRHVAIFLPSLGGGGGERVMLNLSREFLEFCDRVDIVLVSATGALLKEAPAAANLVDLKSASTSRALFRLVKYLREASPDILISTLNTANVIALMAKKMTPKHKSKYFIREANTASRHLAGARTLKKKMLNHLIRKTYPSADRIIAVSEGVSADLRTYLDTDKINLVTIHNPVDIKTIGELAEALPAHPWFADHDKPLVLGVGRLEMQKNFELLIRAFGKVREKVDARLVILGEGSRRAELENLVVKLGLGPFVQMPGFHVNPYSYMARADVFVLPSLWEGFPNSLVEALACGCPVVSTDCPSGPAEILDGGRYGALVAVNDVDSMAESIVDVLTHRQDEGPLVGRARHFSLQDTARQYLGLDDSR